MNTRPLTLILAIVLLLLLSVFGLITPFRPNGPPPIIFLYGVIVGGVGGLIAVVGLWLLKRWALWLTIVISAVSILLGVAGLVIAPAVGKVISAVLMVVYALVLVLVVLPATRRVFAGERARAAA